MLAWPGRTPGAPGARKRSKADLQRVYKQLRDNTPSLTKLSLIWNVIGAEGATTLAQHMRKNSILTSLDLSSNQIGESGARALCEALAANRALTYLDLHSCDLGDVGCGVITKLLKRNMTVRNLGLENNSLGPSGGTAVAEMLAVNTSLKHLDVDRNPLGDQGAWAIARVLKTSLRPVGFELMGVDLWKFWQDLGLPDQACEHEWSNEDVLAFLRGNFVSTDGQDQGQGHIAEDVKKEATIAALEQSSSHDILAANPRDRRLMPSNTMPQDPIISKGLSSAHLSASKDPVEKESGVHASNRVDNASPLPREEMYTHGVNALDEVFLPVPTCNFADPQPGTFRPAAIVGGKDVTEHEEEKNRGKAVVSAEDGVQGGGGTDLSRKAADQKSSHLQGSQLQAVKHDIRLGKGHGSEIGGTEVRGNEPKRVRSAGSNAGRQHASNAVGGESAVAFTCGRCMCCREYQMKMRALAEEMKRHPLWELIDEVRRLQEEVEQGKSALEEQRKVCDRLRQIDAERIASLEVRCVAEKESCERLRKVDADRMSALHQENLALHQARVQKGEEEEEVVRGLHQKLRRLQEKCDEQEEKEAGVLALLNESEAKMSGLETRAFSLKNAIENARETMLMGAASRLREEAWVQERERVLANLEASDVKVRRLKRQLKELMEDSGKLQEQLQQQLCQAKQEHEKERDLLKKQMRQLEEEKLKEVAEWEEVTRRLEEKHAQDCLRLRRRLREQDERCRTLVREHEEEVRRLQKSAEEERLKCKTKVQKLEDEIKRLDATDGRTTLSVDSLSGALSDFTALSRHVGSLPSMPEMPNFLLPLPGLSVVGEEGGGDGVEAQDKVGAKKGRGGSGWLSPSSESSGCSEDDKPESRPLLKMEEGLSPSCQRTGPRPPLLLSSRGGGVEKENVHGGDLVDGGEDSHAKGRTWVGQTDWQVFKGAVDRPPPDGAVPPLPSGDKWNPLSFSAFESGSRS